jgi:translation initiation factor 2 subunit 1
MHLIFCSDSDDDIFEGLDIGEDVKSAVVSYVKRRLAPQPVKIRADIEVTCFTYDGIDAIKDALLEGEGKSVPDAPVKIKLIAPPMYVMTTMTLDKDIGIETLNVAIECIAASIRAKGYVFKHSLTVLSE